MHIPSALFAVTSILCVFTWYRFKYCFRKTIKINKKKKRQSFEAKSHLKTISDLKCKPGPDPKLESAAWLKIGQVKELYIYPLMYGKGTQIQECNLTAKGMIVQQEEEKIELQVGMFAVYDPRSKYIVNHKNHPTLSKIKIIAMDKQEIKLTSTTLKLDLILDIPKIIKHNEIIYCYSTNYIHIEIKYIDCGTTAAKWISKCLTDINMGLRLGFHVDNSEHMSTYVKSIPWGRIMCPYSTLFSLISLQTMQALDMEMICPVRPVDSYSEIIVSSIKPFAEDNWEWVKINNVIMKAGKFHNRNVPKLLFHPSAWECMEKTRTTFFMLRDQGRIKVGDDVYIIPK